MLSSSSFHRASLAPVKKKSPPLSDTIRPYSFIAFRMTCTFFG